MAAGRVVSQKLNGFQRVMLLWEELHPYNAACVLQLTEPPDAQILRECIETACRLVGLGRLAVDAKRSILHYEPLDAVTIKVRIATGRVTDCLNEVLKEEINTPFPPEAHHPIRWILVKAPEAAFVVAICRHVAADAVSLRLLLGEILSCYYGEPHRVGAGFGLEAPGTGFSRERPGYLDSLNRAVQVYSRLRRVYRLQESDGGSQHARVLLLGAPAGLLPRLRRACGMRRVTVHDAFLAALMAALAELTPSRRSHRKRRGLALATAVDLRRIDQERLGDRFGLYVGHWVNTIDDPEALDLEGMLQEITRQTRFEKSAQYYAGHEWHWWTLLFLHRWLSVNENRAWYRKVYPLSAGVSHVRLSRDGFGAAKDKVLRYFLVPPPGPALPLVVAPASLDEDLTFSAVYREASLRASQVERLMNVFFARLEALAC